MYLCERCGSKYSSARFAHIELCPRCLLRDDAASHLVYVPERKAPPAEEPAKPPSEESAAPPAERRPPEPDATSAELG